jgi:hypothetical protein
VEGLLVQSDPPLELIGRQNCASEVVAGAQYVGVVRAEGPGVRKQAMYSWGGGSIQQSLKLDAGMKIIRIVTVSQHFTQGSPASLHPPNQSMLEYRLRFFAATFPDLSDSAAHHSPNSPLRAFGHLV